MDGDSNTNNTPGITRNKYKGLNDRKERETPKRDEERITQCINETKEYTVLRGTVR